MPLPPREFFAMGGGGARIRPDARRASLRRSGQAKQGGRAFHLSRRRSDLFNTHRHAGNADRTIRSRRICSASSRAVAMNMLGKLSWSAIPFDQPIVMGATAVMVLAIVSRPFVDRPGKGHLPYLVARVDHLRRPQAHRRHVLRAGAGHAAARLHRRHHDALAAGHRRRRRARISAAGAFRPDLLGARHDHDLLHGDAVRDRPDEFRRAAAARRARRGLSDAELGEPLADRVRHAADQHLARGRRVRQDRLGRLSAAERAAILARRRRRLLSLVAADLRHRHADDRHQFRHDHPENARARA